MGYAFPRESLSEWLPIVWARAGFDDPGMISRRTANRESEALEWSDCETLSASRSTLHAEQSAVSDGGGRPWQGGVVPLPVNTRLVAAVQNNARAHCHRSANLLSAYYLSADVYRKRMTRGDRLAAEAAWGTVKQAERALREFLTSLFDSSILDDAAGAWSGHRWHDRAPERQGLAAVHSQ